MIARCNVTRKKQYLRIVPDEASSCVRPVYPRKPMHGAGDAAIYQFQDFNMTFSRRKPVDTRRLISESILDN